MATVNYTVLDNSLIQRQPDGTLVVFPASFIGRGISTASGDEGQINAALLQSLPAGAPVKLAALPFLTQSPVVIPGQGLVSSILSGTSPAPGLSSGGGSGGLYATRIIPQSTWSNTAYSGTVNAGAIHMNDIGGSNLYGPVVAALNVDLASGPNGASLCGVTTYGAVEHALIRDVSVRGRSADTTSTNYSYTSYSGHIPRIIMEHCTSQAHGLYGVFSQANDSIFDTVNVQAVNGSTTDSGCWYLNGTSNNVRLNNCRGDQGVYGFITDSNPGGSPNSPGSSISITNSGTQGNYKAGLYVYNSSGTGQQQRTPVLAGDCSFDFCGNDGASPAVLVAGVNLLTMRNCNVTINNSLAGPVSGLKTATIGTGPGVPQLVCVDGGFWNCTGATMFNDAATALVLRYRVYGLAGGAFISTSTPVLFKSGTWP